VVVGRPGPCPVSRKNVTMPRISHFWKNHNAHLVDFGRVNRAALSCLPSLVREWLPDGRRRGCEWVARNPRRKDRNPASFSINLKNGKWADFAVDVKGGYPISLGAYLFKTSQAESARMIALALGIDWRAR
jgi:hypothetical protein